MLLKISARIIGTVIVGLIFQYQASAQSAVEQLGYTPERIRQLFENNISTSSGREETATIPRSIRYLSVFRGMLLDPSYSLALPEKDRKIISSLPAPFSATFDTENRKRLEEVCLFAAGHGTRREDILEAARMFDDSKIALEHAVSSNYESKIELLSEPTQQFIREKMARLTDEISYVSTDITMYGLALDDDTFAHAVLTDGCDDHVIEKNANDADGTTLGEMFSQPGMPMDVDH